MENEKICHGACNLPLLDEEHRRELLRRTDSWVIEDGSRLTKTYTFKDFASAVSWVNRVAAEAEQKGHHPDIFLTWGKVKIDLWTHSAGGITEADFSLARALDQTFERAKSWHGGF